MYLLFLAFLLFLLFLQLKVPEGFKIWNESRGTDYWGNDLAHGVYSLRECKKRCIQNASCKGITTDSVNGRPGNCWIKSQLTQGAPSGLNSYLLSRV